MMGDDISISKEDLPTRIYEIPSLQGNLETSVRKLNIGSLHGSLNEFALHRQQYVDSSLKCPKDCK